jgi:hypothetical protein
MNFDKSLSDIEKILAEHKTLHDYIDETGEVFVFASTLLSMLIAPNPVSAIALFGLGTDILAFRFSKLFKWIPEKLEYWDKGKEVIVVQRYEKAALVNMMIFHIAIKEAVKEIMPKYIEEYQKCLKSESEGEKEKRKQKLSEEGKRVDRKIRNLILSFGDDIERCTATYIHTICEEFVSEVIQKIKLKNSSKRERQISKEEILKKIEEATITNYNAYLIHLSNEFPEFALWVDLEQKDKIFKKQKQILKQLKELSEKKADFDDLKNKFNDDVIEIQNRFIKTTEETLEKIESIKDYSFEKDYGFSQLLSNQDFVSRKLDDLKSIYKEDKLIHIEAHHNGIKDKLEEKLNDNKDIDGIVYPKTKEIFVPQSFKAFPYHRKHQKKFLLDSFWETEVTDRGENVGRFIINELNAPRNSFNPIIILGNPGAGKSMLSQVLAARLCESNGFVPFFVRLRDVSLMDTIPKNHINEGIKNATAGNPDVDWINWAREFKNRIPVIILDGFDELLRASQAEINNYIVKVQNLLESAYKGYGISARVILTSRLTVMQDVDIPNNTTIIRLESFDSKRQDQWIEQWNSFQTKKGFNDFKLPSNPSIIELGKEPLLLFMLAVYDFENSELQSAALEQDFNQSKLYDKLFDKFTQRQLDKALQYGRLSKIKKERLSKKFRLRLGAIATLMFLNDVTHKETQNLRSELNSFGIGGEDAEPSLIFKGFFFIHKDKSTEMTGMHSYTFEFIHKSFGEFLTADFLVRTVIERFESEDEIEKFSKNDTLRFCWGFNWLNKHYNTTRFVFEYVDILVDDLALKKQIVKLIKSELKEIFGTKINLFPVSDLSLIDSKPVIEHLGIYSQNLILLWVALNKKEAFSFNLYTVEENIRKDFHFEYQDRTDINQNKKAWKKICKLWEISGGNKYSIGKVKEWIAVNETEENILLNFKNGESKFNFGDSAEVTCNDYELLLSYVDNPISLNEIKSIVQRKPEFLITALNIINDKYDFFFKQNEDLLLKESTELMKQETIPFPERIRLLEKLNIYYSNIDVYFHFRDLRKIFSEGRRQSASALMETTGNIPYWFFRNLEHEDDDIINTLDEKQIEQLGLERYLKLIKGHVKYELGRNRTRSFERVLELKLYQIIEEGSDEQVANYLSIVQEAIKKHRFREPVLSPDFLRHVFEKIFIRRIENEYEHAYEHDYQLDNSYFIFQYLKSVILSIIYFNEHQVNRLDKGNYDFIPNKILEICFYQKRILYQDLIKRNNFRLFVSHFELLVISLKNRNIQLAEDVRAIINICAMVVNYMEKEGNRHHHHSWELPRYIDLLSVLSESPIQGVEYHSVLYKTVRIFWSEETKRGERISYFYHLKLLNTIVKYRDVFEESLIEEVVFSLYKNTKELRRLESRQVMIFSILLFQSGMTSRKFENQLIDDITNRLRRFHTDFNLDAISEFANEFLYELNNNFYYEIHHSNSFSHFVLRRSILHGDEDQF